MTNSQGPPQDKGSTIGRYISFVMLCVTIVVCGFYFYSVIKGFLLPLFLACLMVVIFRPFHEWMCQRCGRDRPALAATLTTGAIMLLVLVPLAGLVALGLYEANQLVRNRGEYIDKVGEVRLSMGLQKPFAAELDAIESELRKLDDAISNATTTDEPYLATLIVGSRDEIARQLLELKVEARDAVKVLGSAKEEVPEEIAPAVSQLRKDLYDAVGVGAIGPELGEELEEKDRSAEVRCLRRLLKRQLARSGIGLLEMIDEFGGAVSSIPFGAERTATLPTEEDTVATRAPRRATTILEQNNALTDVQVEYNQLQTALLGGPIWKWGIELVNPSEDQINDLVGKWFSGSATRWLPSITNTATSLIAGLMVGLGIMSVAMFYFFLDGPKMLSTFMQLSPLDDRHEMELLVEFDKVSRAVVLATLLSAVAQGLLGGIGYWIVGLNSFVLLSLLTTVLSMIPFVGAAAVWVPCCLYVAFIMEPSAVDGSRGWLYAKAGFLAVYGVLGISMVDNLIKPWVLQGQSKLHPLLALLSVLGGVQALGPIGILIGPMVVAFLQVLLTILQREIRSMDEEHKAAARTA